MHLPTADHLQPPDAIAPPLTLAGEPGEAHSRALLACIDSLMRHTPFAQAAQALCAELRLAFDCEHVGLGLIQGDTLQLLAWSDLADLRQQLSGARSVAAAMQEAVEQQCHLRFPPQNEDAPRITLMHTQLARSGLGEAILSLPLVSREDGLVRIEGAVTLLRPANQPWRDADISQLSASLAVLAPLLMLKQAAEASAFKRLAADWRRQWQRLRGPDALPLKIAAGLALTLLLSITIIPVSDDVSASARVEGLVERSLAAPADSYIQEVLVRPGSVVKANDLLMTLADEDLRNEQRRLESELARHRGDQAEAFARQDRAKMVAAQSRADEAAAQLALISDQLARTRITAPFAGQILSGDLQQKAGAPVRRGDVLMVMAPLGEHRLILQVDERDIGRLKLGDRGRVAFSALPGNRYDIEVERITPVAAVVNGRNGFEVQAALRSPPTGIRSGLEGTARIGQGSAPWLVLQLRRLSAWLDYQIWDWLA